MEKQIPIQIDAYVAEVRTNHTEEAKGIIFLNKQPLQLEISSDEDVFRTGLPFEAEVKIKNVQDSANTTVQICYEPVDTAMDWKVYFSACSNFTINADTSIAFTVPPFTQNISLLQVHVIYSFYIYNTCDIL